MFRFNAQAEIQNLNVIYQLGFVIDSKFQSVKYIP